MKARRVFIPVLVILLLSLPFSLAQSPRRPKGGKIREEVREKIQLLKMWKMTDYLDLDEETSLKVFQIVKKYDDLEHKARSNNMNLISTLKKELAKDKVDTNITNELMKKIKTNFLNEKSITIERFSELSKYLTPEQQAKYLVFEFEFHMEIARLTQQALGGGGPRGKRLNDNKDNNGPPFDQ
ncbi:MAG: hypothetical protein JW737_04910 [Acidobacteria bacterium]|nr:hypothetical protein [Acidobacteriota bacterium]